MNNLLELIKDGTSNYNKETDEVMIVLRRGFEIGGYRIVGFTKNKRNDPLIAICFVPLSNVKVENLKIKNEDKNYIMETMERYFKRYILEQKLTQKGDE